MPDPFTAPDCETTCTRCTVCMPRCILYKRFVTFVYHVLLHAAITRNKTLNMLPAYSNDELCLMIMKSCGSLGFDHKVRNLLDISKILLALRDAFKIWCAWLLILFHPNDISVLSISCSMLTAALQGINHILSG